MAKDGREAKKIGWRVKRLPNDRSYEIFVTYPMTLYQRISEDRLSDMAPPLYGELYIGGVGL